MEMAIDADVEKELEEVLEWEWVRCLNLSTRRHKVHDSSDDRCHDMNQVGHNGEIGAKTRSQERDQSEGDEKHNDRKESGNELQSKCFKAMCLASHDGNDEKGASGCNGHGDNVSPGQNEPQAEAALMTRLQPRKHALSSFSPSLMVASRHVVKRRHESKRQRFRWRRQLRHWLRGDGARLKESLPQSDSKSGTKALAELNDHLRYHPSPTPTPSTFHYNHQPDGGQSLRLRGGAGPKRLEDDERVSKRIWFLAGGMGPAPTGATLRKWKEKDRERNKKTRKRGYWPTWLVRKGKKGTKAGENGSGGGAAAAGAGAAAAGVGAGPGGGGGEQPSGDAPVGHNSQGAAGDSRSDSGSSEGGSSGSDSSSRDGSGS